MSYKIVKAFPNNIFFDKNIPCISLYQPTHRYFPENKPDVIVFKNLVRDIEISLKQKYRKTSLDIIMEPFYSLIEDKLFWNNTLDGIAVFANPDKCIVYKLYRALKELAIVADSFHIKPLIRIFQTMDRYQLLGLSNKDFTIYEGNRYELERLEIEPDSIKNIDEFLNNRRAGSHLTHISSGDPGNHGIYHGYGGKKDETDKDIDKFFRYVDDFVLENFSKTSKLPLILVSLKEHQNKFKKISHNPFLMEEGIKIAHDSIEKDKLIEKVWEIMEPLYSVEIQNLLDSYNNAVVNVMGSDNLAKIAHAVLKNRVDTIIIESDKIIPGKIDYTSGKIQLGDLANPDFDDVLDDLAEMVLKKNGKVAILPKDKMPCNTGIAAIYRY